MLNGDVLSLAAGDYAATVTSAGATLASLTHRGRPLTWGFDPAGSLGLGYNGRVLAPWPNRLVGAAFEWEGERLSVPCNEPETGAALHGMVCFADFQVEEATASSALLSLSLPASPGYPFPLVVSVKYLLEASSGLQVVIAATNVGDRAAPVGLGAHPYLVPGFEGAPAAVERDTAHATPPVGALDGSTLCCPARAILEADARKAPLRLVPVEGTAADFTAPALLRNTELDHALTDLPERWSVTLTSEAGGVAVSSGAPWVQLFTGELFGRIALAVEPMTCGPDAFHRDPEGVRLDPGQTRVLEFAIAAIEPDPARPLG